MYVALLDAPMVIGVSKDLREKENVLSTLSNNNNNNDNDKLVQIHTGKMCFNINILNIESVNFSSRALFPN